MILLVLLCHCHCCNLPLQVFSGVNVLMCLLCMQECSCCRRHWLQRNNPEMQKAASMASMASVASMENMASTLVWMIHALFVQIFNAKKHLCYFLRLLQLCLKRTFFPRVKHKGVPLPFTPSKAWAFTDSGLRNFPKKTYNVECWIFLNVYNFALNQTNCSHCIGWNTTPVRNCQRMIDEWSNEWVGEWVSQWVSEWVSQWVSESVSQWVSESVSQWVSE